MHFLCGNSLTLALYITTKSTSTAAAAVHVRYKTNIVQLLL